MNRIQTMERHNGKLVLVLRDVRGIIFIDYLEKSQTVNKKYSMVLLECLNDEIKKKTAPLEEKKVLFHQENALCHISIKTTAILHELGYKLLPHPPFFQIWPPVTFFCLQTSKKCLLEKNLALIKR
jgi:hypothetical protein